MPPTAELGIECLLGHAHGLGVHGFRAASRISWASTANMGRRLTTPAPAWRDDFVAAA